MPTVSMHKHDESNMLWISKLDVFFLCSTEVFTPMPYILYKLERFQNVQISVHMHKTDDIKIQLGA